MKKIYLAAAGILAMTAAASAADFPMKAAMAPAPVYSWTGFYIGGNVGGGSSTVAFGDPCFYCSSGNVTKGFVTGGAQIGYNYQFGNGLVGLEADVNGNNINNKFFMGGDDTNALNAGLKSDLSGTIRARGGLVLNNALIYVTGGAAWADVQQSGVEVCNSLTGFCRGGVATFGAPTGITANGNSTTVWGAVIGAGVEYALGPNWTVGGEFLHTMYQHTSANIVNASGGNSCAGNNNVSATNCVITSQLTTDVARIRFNYKFN
jgi:opacity protein-like surface antigen